MSDFLAKKLRRFLPLTFDTLQPEHRTDVGAHAVFPDGFHGTNPSLVRVEGGYLVCVRGVNYVLSGPGMGQPVFTAGDHYMTVNRFFIVDHGFGLICRLPGLDAAFDDVEDIKLFEHEGRVMGSGSCPDPGGGPGARVIGLLTLDPAFKGGGCRLIASPFGLQQEKNWAPFVHRGSLLFIYSFDPLIILRCDSHAGSVSFADPASAGLTGNNLKFLVGGSSAGLPVAGGFLFLGHRRRVTLPRMHRTYVSRAYYLDSATMRLAAGRYFSLGPASIQFINGLAEQGDSFVISYGAFDRHAYLCRAPKARLLATLPSGASGGPPRP